VLGERLLMVTLVDVPTLVIGMHALSVVMQ
jgi:hypothetical protein